MILELILALAIASAHYLSEYFVVEKAQNKIKVISFVAGISVVYVFVGLFPEFYRQAASFSPLMLTAAFLGFSTFHLIDKEIYKKIEHKHLRNDIMLAHGYGLMIYYAVVGMVLVKLLSVSVREGVLFFIPVFTYSAISTLSSHPVFSTGPHFEEIKNLQLYQALAILVGTGLALFLAIPDSVLVYLVGIVAGILMHVVMKDMLPKGKKGRPLFFVIGAGVYLALVIILWFV